MFTKNKTFLSKSKYFLLATSSIGLLASAEALAVDIVPVAGNVSVRTRMEWRHNRVHYLPQDNDNIILSRNDQNINFDQNINIGNINLYGFTSNGFVIHASNPTSQISINNIVNFNDHASEAAVQNALGYYRPYGGKDDSKVQIRLLQDGADDQSELTIKGDDISAVDSILLDGASATLIFEKPITVTAPIYSSVYNRGNIVVKDNAVFEAPIGHDGINNCSIYVMTIDDNKSVTLKSDIYATDIVLEKDSKLIIDSSRQDIKVSSGVAINDLGGMHDGNGIIQVNGNTENTITFHNDIGSRDIRVGEINIERGKKTNFNNNVYAKGIKVAINYVEFKEKLDMQHHRLDIKGKRIELLDTGNLEFTKHGEIKFHKDFTGNITAKMPKLGIVTFVNTSDIYGVGSEDKKIEKLIFEGAPVMFKGKQVMLEGKPVKADHIHNLHKDIHAERVDFDRGTYNIATEDVKIDGNANINGSTLNLNKHNLIFIEKVEFSNNINLFVTGRNKLIFENHAPTVGNPGANIIITIDGAQPADEGTALAALQVNVKGAFPPVGSHYDAVTGILVLPGLGGAIPAGPVRAPVPVVAAPAPIPAPPPLPGGGAPAGGAAAPGGAVAVVPAPAPAPAPVVPAGAPPAVGGAAAPVAPAPGGVAAAPAVPPPAAPILVVAVAPTPPAPVVSPVIELANAISNIIVSAEQGAPANKATQEVINKRAVSVMQNPEKHAAELAKELASSGTDFKDAARVANDDAYVTGKMQWHHQQHHR